MCEHNLVNWECDDCKSDLERLIKKGWAKHKSDKK